MAHVKTMKGLWLLVTVGAAALAACSSGSKGSGGGSSSSSSGSGSSSSGGSSGGSSGSSGGCSCDVDYNGVDKDLPCGQSGCVNGEQFSCGSGAALTDEGACTSSGSSGGSSGGGSSSDGGSGSSSGGGEDSDGGGEAGPSCVTLLLSCANGSCCSGLNCFSDGAGDDTCFEDRGGPCQASTQCTPGVAGGPGDVCMNEVCCGSSGAVCAQAGSDPGCCSGQCVQNGNIPQCM
jgi:hypothetical protein